MAFSSSYGSAFGGGGGGSNGNGSGSSGNFNNSRSNSSLLSNQPLYEEISVIGTGAYGTVYKGCDLKTSRIVAMKRIRIQITEEGLPISTIREIGYLRHLDKYDHENVVKLLDVINGPRLPSEQSVILIFEYIDYDLDTYVRAHTAALGEAHIRDLMRQLLTGVDFLHSNRLIHRDLKPQNVLVTKEGRVKIADFGLARIYGFTMALTSVVVTLWYRSPEVLLHSTYTTSVDMWSVGCIFAELCLRRPLFAGESDVDQLYKIFGLVGLPSERDWPVNSVIPLASFQNNANLVSRSTLSDATAAVAAVVGGDGKQMWPDSAPSQLRCVLRVMDDHAFDLVQRLLDYNVTDRITARDALVHAYFTESKQTQQKMQHEQQQQQHNVLNASSLVNNVASRRQATSADAPVAGAASFEKQMQQQEQHQLQQLNAPTGIVQPNILKRKRAQQLNIQNVNPK